MAMNPMVSNLLSGLFGALVGAYISMRIYRRSRRDAAQRKLLGMVYRIGFKSWHYPEPGKPAMIFHRNYPALWAAYAELHGCLPFWRRRSLEKAWQKYMHMDHYYDEIPDDQLGKVFNKGTVSTQNEAVQVSSDFVGFLTKELNSIPGAFRALALLLRKKGATTNGEATAK